MTRLRFVAVLAAAVVLGLGPGLGAQEQDPAGVPRVPLAEFKALLARKAILAIDVRDPHSYENGHIPGARNVSYVDVEIRANGLRKQPLPIVAYCA